MAAPGSEGTPNAPPTGDRDDRVAETTAGGGFSFWIDRGGTFTDVIGVAPDGTLHTAKLLSSPNAPVEGIRTICAAVLGVAPDQPLPPCAVKLGTTVATNALLERRGTRTLLVTHAGLGDAFTIGTQARPELFSLEIAKPAPLHGAVVEAMGRCGASGQLWEEEDSAALADQLAQVRREGFTAVALVAMHASRHPELERRWAAVARRAGFDHVAASHQVAREQGFLARGETAIADAYLTPLLRRHSAELQAALPSSRLRFMQSSGGLTEAERFSGPRALLSGPAGGVVGAAAVARAAGCRHALGFDMGGTSTDVSLIVDGEVERAFETEVAGIRVRAPMLRIHTVAAGGGSLCRFDGFRLSVGPQSAGAEPGPLCYGRASAQGELALTDINLFLGRLQADRFPFPLTRAPLEDALARLEASLRSAGHDLDRLAIATGFVEIANAAMAQAIQQISVARGVDPRDCALVGFGGAGGQHVCGVARRLGISRILLHPLAGLLSAYGIGVAPLSWDGQTDARQCLLGQDGRLPPRRAREWTALEDRGRAALLQEGASREELRVERSLDCRYRGTETALTVAEPADGDWARAFAVAHRARFSYERSGRPVEVTALRLRVRAPGRGPAGSGQAVAEAGGAAAPSPHADPRPRRRAEVWFSGRGRIEVPIFDREALAPGHSLAGPALVLEATGTVVIDPGFRARVTGEGILDLEDGTPGRSTTVVPARPATAHAPPDSDLDRPDPVRLEVFGHRFMSIAEQMGAVLRNTSVSANIKERLDYSCAVFDAAGGLVANAPHIPVHLGAMQETVRVLRTRFPDLGPDDALITNDPFQGGSHLPDVTVVTPVFLDGATEPACFVGSRGHHADLGGITPGSMPAHSRSLSEEGIVLEPTRLLRSGHFDEAGLRRRLATGPYPARNPDDNVADIEAMLAANRTGVAELRTWAGEVGTAALRTTMQQLQAGAAAAVAREIGRLPPGEHRFRDRLDDGTPIAVRLEVAGERMVIDFAGTGAAVPGNLNAPAAVVHAAVLYVLRSLVTDRIPLNGGCLAPVEIRTPAGSVLDPPPGSAVVGGNVETSQRVVDVLLGALGLAAASQGTMNNVTFGTADFGYYETIGGGAGAGPRFHGASGVHVHMTNTRITDPEVLESRYPVRLLEFSLRRGSGGAGRYRGGDGLRRRYEFLAPVSVSLLSERRDVAPWGLAGGRPGATGRNGVERRGGRIEWVGGKAQLELAMGDRLLIETPGGGGFGAPA